MDYKCARRFFSQAAFMMSAAAFVIVPAPAQAQLDMDELFNDQLAAQQDNISENLADMIEAGFADGLSPEEIEQLSAQNLAAQAAAAQYGEGAPGGAPAQAAPAPTSLVGSDILEDYENTQALLNKYSGLSAYERRAGEPPLPLSALQNLPKENVIAEEDGGLPFDIRRDAIREAAISYGARGGLAWRTYAIMKEMERRSRYMDRVFDFRQLLVPAPSGLLIEPPIISESINAMLIEGGGQEAAVSDRIYNIVNNARIVSAPRTWRTYLERTWPAVEPPPDILRPQTEEERKLWIELVSKGWQEGIEQADAIFKEDLNRLLADFRGMVRYRLLLAQGMVSAPYALQVDRGITGGGEEMRIGDRAVQITGVPQLISGASRWKPASR